MVRVCVAVIAGWWATTCVAQQSVRPETVGAVTGHVICSDTQRPARLAQVKLVRAPTAAEMKSLSGHGMAHGSADAAEAGDVVETGLDGGYTIRNVKPGAYYLVVDMEGYLLPLEQFSKKDLNAADDETRARVAKAVKPFVVEANQTSRQDVVVERGASVAGTVTYDDGTPASGVGIQLLVKGKDGKFVPMSNGRYRSYNSRSSTDDNGQYRITGLPPGEYATEADLALSDHLTTFGPMPGSPSTVMSMEIAKTRFSLPLYSGDALRKPDAKAYALGSGEVRAGADLVFPLARLHRVDGQVLAKDGHAVNGGDVKVLYPDDKSEMTEAAIQFEDQQFHLEYVPEGDYLLQVAGAKDLTNVQVENPAGYSPHFHEETRTVKSYGDAEQALVVKGDTSGVVAMVPEAGKSDATSNP